MSLTKRLVVLIVIAVVFLLLPAVETSAQAPATTCTGLSAADCKIITTADANMKDVTSLSFKMLLKFNYKFGKESGNANLQGSGGFEYDPSAVGTSPTEALNAFKMTADISGPTTLGQTLSGGSVTVTYHMIIADGNLYYRENEADQWQGFSLADAITRYQSSNPLGGSLGSSANTQAAQKLFTDPAVLKAIMAIPNIKGFITQARTKTSPTVDGQKQIEFVTTYNILTLLKAKEMLPLYTAIMKSSGSKTSYSSSQLAQIAQVVANSLTGTSFKITRWVGATDQMYHSLGIDFVLRFNGAGLGMASSSGSVDFHFSFQMTNIGQPQDITAPTDANMIDTNP